MKVGGVKGGGAKAPRPVPGPLRVGGVKGAVAPSPRAVPVVKLGKVRNPVASPWRCALGCPGANVAGRWVHHWQCGYWSEHSDETPF